MKHYKKARNRYNEETVKTLFEHLRGVVHPINNGCQNIVDVCEGMVLNECTEDERFWFVWTMHCIIKETGEYFTPLPDNLKPYYSKYFSDVLKVKYLNSYLLPKLTKNAFKTHFKCLFEAFVDEKVRGVHKN